MQVVTVFFMICVFIVNINVNNGLKDLCFCHFVGVSFWGNWFAY